MVRINFPYPEMPHLDIPEKNLMGVYTLPLNSDVPKDFQVIQNALNTPIATAGLQEMVAGKSRILIVSDDHHRPTPMDRILPQILQEIHNAGITHDQIEIIMALGSHRPMTTPEIKAKLGEKIASTYLVSNHNWQNKDNLYFAGRVESGVDVWVNRKVKEADFVLGLGRIMPIEVCGFTGGCKIIIPGLCGEKTNSDFHWIRVDIPDEQIIGKRDNPVREAIDKAALAAGIDAIFNVVLEGQNRIVEAVFGHPIEAHRTGVELARKWHAVSLPEPADIVIVDGYPFDVEFWQANKALDTAGMVVRPGGVIIVVSPCYDGLSRSHENEILKFGYQTSERIKELVKENKIEHLVAAVHMIQVAHATIDKQVTCILTTNGIPREVVRQANLEYAHAPDDALNQALRLAGPNAKIAVLHRAAEMLISVDEPLIHDLNHHKAIKENHCL